MDIRIRDQHECQFLRHLIRAIVEAIGECFNAASTNVRQKSMCLQKYMGLAKCHGLDLGTHVTLGSRAEALPMLRCQERGSTGAKCSGALRCSGTEHPGHQGARQAYVVYRRPHGRAFRALHGQLMNTLDTLHK